MKSNRRSFLGFIGALIASPAVAESKLVAGRGLTTSTFHVDEFGYTPVMGKSGQVLMADGNGNVVWRDLSTQQAVERVNRELEIVGRQVWEHWRQGA